MPRDSIFDWSKVANPGHSGDDAPAPCPSCQTAGSGYESRVKALPWEERLWAGVSSVGSTAAGGLVQHGALPARMPWEEEARDERARGLVVSTRRPAGNAFHIGACYPALGKFMRTGSTPQYPNILPPTGAGDFVPGFPSSPSAAVASLSSPLGDRILIAVSKDGMTWTKTGLIVMESGSVPSLAVEDNALFLFCNATNSSTGRGEFVMAWTEDLVNWQYNVPARLGVTSVPTGTYYTFDANDWLDPSVVRRVKVGDGGWYLFFTVARPYTGSVPPGTHARGANTFVAKAASLLDRQWTLVNGNNPVYPDILLAELPASAYGASPWEVADPGVVYMERGASTPYYQYFASPIDATGTAISGMANLKITFDSSDIATVTVMPNLVRNVTLSTATASTEAHFSNGLETVAGEYRWWAFGQDTSTSPAGAEIFSYTLPYPGPAAGRWTSKWTPDSTSPVLVLDQTYESYCVQDAAVVQFKGCYVMAYTTKIP